ETAGAAVEPLPVVADATDVAVGAVDVETVVAWPGVQAGDSGWDSATTGASRTNTGSGEGPDVKAQEPSACWRAFICASSGARRKKWYSDGDIALRST